MRKAHRMYQGCGADLAVQSEIIVRGYNVHDPRVEEGPDFHVALPTAAAPLWRVEVKSCRAVERGLCQWRANFRIRPANIADDALPELVFVFAIRHPVHWDYLIISRKDLLERLPPNQAIHRPYHDVALRFDITPPTLPGPGGHDYTDFMNNWSRYWPALQ